MSLTIVLGTPQPLEPPCPRADIEGITILVGMAYQVLDMLDDEDVEEDVCMGRPPTNLWID
jgi:hypothetical protein